MDTLPRSPVLLPRRSAPVLPPVPPGPERRGAETEAGDPRERGPSRLLCLRPEPAQDKARPVSGEDQQDRIITFEPRGSPESKPTDIHPPGTAQEGSSPVQGHPFPLCPGLLSPVQDMGTSFLGLGTEEVSVHPQSLQGQKVSLEAEQ